MFTRWMRCAGLATGAWIAAAPAGAQTPEPTGRSESQTTISADRDLKFTAGAGYEHQFEAGIDGGGDFSVSRLTGGLSLARDLTDELGLSLRLAYGLDIYDFTAANPPVGLGADPWDDIHTISAAAIATWRMDPQWTFFGGPVMQFARESGASWSDSLIVGGVLGATYSVSKELTIGGGFGVVSQIEDSARVFPVIIVSWNLSEGVRVASQTASNASGRTGVELIWTAKPGFELALGAASEFARFRLDGSGVAPDGVGQNESFPIWLRASWDAAPNFKVDVFAGMQFAGQLRLENSTGGFIAEQDYDPAPFLGVFANVRF